ncbi:LytR C-terminal domain-containing protein [Blastococcus sp. URHD0036]|uniref:LytR C-terminal domain-containing protein n=1 Tax=Blastococcus sp. URHD0036 TaxID=1380356 RepID=UPI000AEC89E1|nr:LytR C-terminal domain-containing protein [Blastococcus sp. URHD0036]
MAPFQAVPAPAPTEHPSAPLPDVSSPSWDRAWLDEAPPADAPATVVPTVGQRPGKASRAPVAPSPAVPNGNPAYRDWTRPSGSGAAPATTAIPDREIVRDRVAAPETVVPPTEVPALAAPATEVPDAGPHEVDAPADDRFSGGRGSGLPDQGRGERPRSTGPTSGSQTGVVGGRAALRAERRAAEEERRREDKRNGVKHVRVTVPGTEEDEPRPTRRRGVGALVAVVVVALLVLGVYSFASPETQEASDDGRAAVPTTSAPLPTSAALPPLSAEPLPPVDQAPATPVRVPVSVLNSTDVTGLAGDIADVLGEGGWPTLETGPYPGTDVAVTTVYFTEGNEAQRQSALQLVEAHPEVSGPAVRFFEVSAAAADGLVVVAAGDWTP